MNIHCSIFFAAQFCKSCLRFCFQIVRRGQTGFLILDTGVIFLYGSTQTVTIAGGLSALTVKTRFIAIALVVAFSAIARIIVPFSSWDHVEESSPCVMVVECGDSIPSTPGVIMLNGPQSYVAIKVLYVLKGTNGVVATRLMSDCDLEKGHDYLVFGFVDGAICQAFEEYRVVALGHNFPTNAIAGKPFEEQLQILFKHRLKILNRQIAKDLEEKQRLDQAVQK